MKIGVIGTGSIGFRHVNNMLSNTLNKIKVSVFDPSRSNYDDISAKGGKCYCSLDELFSQKLDGVVIASPSQYHVQHLLSSARKKLFIFCEKPICCSSKEVGLLEADIKNQEKIMVGYNLHFHPAVLEAKKIFDEGLLGEVLYSDFCFSDYLPRWRPKVNHLDGYANDPIGGGVVLDSSHEINLLQCFFPKVSVFKSIIRNTGSIGLEKEDFFKAMLFDKNSNAIITLHLDYISKKRRKYFFINGTLGSLYVDLDGRTLELHTKEKKVNNYVGSYDNDYVSEIEAFIEFIQTGSHKAVGFREAISCIKLISHMKELASFAHE